MAIFKDSERLAKFTAALSEQRNRISKLLLSISGLGYPENMKPSIFRRFLITLDQVAEAKETETKIINQIDDIEEKHRKKRAHHLLRRAEPLPSTPSVLPEPCEPEAKRKDNSIWWWLALWYALSGNKPNHK